LDVVLVKVKDLQQQELVTECSFRWLDRLVDIAKVKDLHIEQDVVDVTVNVR
jgi:hypothetical protein